MFKKSIVVVCFFCVFNTVSALADTYIPLGSHVYGYLKRLEGEGLIKSGQLATLPVSRSEGARLTTEAIGTVEKADSPYVQTLVEKLRAEFKYELEGEFRAYLAPADTASATYEYADGASFFRQKNRDGVAVIRGNNGLVYVTPRFDSPFLGLSATPELRVYEDETYVKLKKAYALLNVGREEFFFGKESAWWGPGENGALLLSNNAEPITMARLSNSIPYDIFGVGFRGTFFISELEKDRADVRSPIFWGARLDFRPASFMEIGLSRTAFFGGEGHKTDFPAFLHSITGIDSNTDTSSSSEIGDEKAGFDVKFTLPLPYQPITLYMEGAGEDQAGLLPSRWAYIWGFYLPRIANLERLEARGEYATTSVSGHPEYWYHHHIYTQGYTFKGRIIGDYIGSDAHDSFLWTRYNFDDAAVSVSYERLKKQFPNTFVWEDYGVSVTHDICKNVSFEVSGNYSHEDRNNIYVGIGLNYRQ